MQEFHRESDGGLVVGDGRESSDYKYIGEQRHYEYGAAVGSSTFDERDNGICVDKRRIELDPDIRDCGKGVNQPAIGNQRGGECFR